MKSKNLCCDVQDLAYLRILILKTMKKLFDYLKFGSFVAVLFAVLLMASCSEDEPEVNPLVGTYELTQAYFTGVIRDEPTDPDSVVTEILFKNFPQADGSFMDVTVPAGVNGAAFATSILAGAITDVDPDDFPDFDCADEDVRIDLRADGTFFITCATGGTEVPQGTWTEIDGSLVIFITNIGTQAVIDNPVLSNNVLTGTIARLPLPKDFLLNPPPVSRLFYLETDITFTKQ